MRIWIVKRASVSVTPICTLIDSSVFMRIAVRYHRRDRGTRASSRERKREREDIPLRYHTRAPPENRVTSDPRWNLRLTFHPSRIEEVKTNFSLFAARSIEEMDGRILVSIFHQLSSVRSEISILSRRESVSKLAGIDVWAGRYRSRTLCHHSCEQRHVCAAGMENTVSTVITNRWHADKYVVARIGVRRVPCTDISLAVVICFPVAIDRERGRVLRNA